MLGPEGIPPTQDPPTFEELQLATRNRGMPLEALRYDVTPTGLHYLLVHYDIPLVDAPAWRLRIGGAVDAERTIGYEELRAMPARTLRVTMECAGNGRARLRPRPVSQPWLSEAIGTADWTGVPLATLLEAAGVAGDAVDVVFTGADHGTERGIEQDYARSLSIGDATQPDVLVAYAMNGEPLQPQHGHPARLVVPGWYGMASVKWLQSIDVSREPFDGHQMRAYSYRRSDDDAGEPVTRIKVRALMTPPGFPDFLTRRRIVDAGPVTIGGRAWSGEAPVARVELGVDGDWREAKLHEPDAGPYAWHAWTAEWEATPGEHELACRAADESGAAQPDEQPWNYGGFGNNQIQRVAVTVR